MKRILKFLSVISGAIIMGSSFVFLLVASGDVHPNDDSSLSQLAKFVFREPVVLILLIAFTFIGGMIYLNENEEDRQPSKLGKALNWFCAKLMGE